MNFLESVEFEASAGETETDNNNVIVPFQPRFGPSSRNVFTIPP